MEVAMGEHKLHRKEGKKTPQKSIKEKRREKRNKEKHASIPSA
jgi:hypothetical protein